jgi:hypothetical protein
MTSFRIALRILCVAAGLLVFTACSSTPPPAPSPRTVEPSAPTASTEGLSSEEVATVYIYRPKDFIGFALHPTVMLDGKDLINIGNGRLFVGRFPPGRRVFKMDDGKSGAEIDLEAGQSYYLQVVIVPGFWKGGGRMSHVTPQQGGVEIRDLKPIELEEIEDTAFRQQARAAL